MKNSAILIFGVISAVSFASAAVIRENEFSTIHNQGDNTNFFLKNFLSKPGSIKCERNDPEFNQCIESATNEKLPKILNLLPILFDIDSIDPLSVERGEFSTDSGGTLILENCTMNGISKVTVKDVDIHLLDLNNGFTSKMTIYFPKILIEGNFEADNFKIDELELTQKGRFNLTLSEISIKLDMSVNVQFSDIYKYYQYTKFNIQPEIGDLKISATDLLPDKADKIAKAALDYANQYWASVKFIVEPFLTEQANKILRTYL